MTDRFTVHGITSDALHTHAIERLTAALDQHDDRVASVNLQFHDLNGPKGGHDKEAKVIIGLRGAGDVIVEERGDDAYSILSVLADRVKQAVGRKIDKHARH
jgi:putative sigma-54 modulation protein